MVTFIVFLINMSSSDSAPGENSFSWSYKNINAGNSLDASHKKTNYAPFIDHPCSSNTASGCGKGLYFSLYDVGKDAGIQILVTLTEQD